MAHYVFIGGLHRSGTSLLAECLGQHPCIATFQNTGVPEDEGQHLQTVFRPAKAHGGPGRFAFDPRAHLTETSPQVQAGLARTLFQQWREYWDVSKPVLLEKSPPNLIRARFLQAMVDRLNDKNAEVSFIMITRHPLAVAMATRKWCSDSVPRLIEHWCRAHEIFEADRPGVRRLITIRYEDLVSDFAGTLGQIWSFLSLPTAAVQIEIDRGSNDRYLEQWREQSSGLAGIRSRWAVSRMLCCPIVRLMGYQ